ncbi:MAG: polysaccharide deacetylase family protein [Bifidobacteriaceae bacterium]|jgi:peptidoglycan/xylan/chitin deacetylase (PgdA/CDA1 family)|nr:polysaccharide deacetylase family protein [Bifidobacteriaceae bacterium]
MVFYKIKKPNSLIKKIIAGVVICLILGLATYIIWSKIQNKTNVISQNATTKENTSSGNSCPITLIDSDNANNGKILNKSPNDIYGDLPIPQNNQLINPNANLVFDGWWNESNGGQRIGPGTDIICHSQLYGRWITKQSLINANIGVPILMFHYFTAKANNSTINANYQLASDFDKQMKYLHDNNYYYPSWTELSAFIDGKLALPKKSVMVTDDDNEISWYETGVPIINKYKIYATMFCITGSWWETRQKSPSKYIMQRSHTNGMHSPENGNFIGYMINLPADKIARDLEKSAAKLGVKQVLAYPAGEYNDEVKKGVRSAGFDMAVTTQSGVVKIGTNKLELPRIRMSYGQELTSFIADVN